MEKTARAQLNNLRIAPRKVRLVADLVRGKDVADAERILSMIPNKSALPMAKVLKSAIANAKQVLSEDTARMYIARLLVNEGAKLKRFMPRARGQATPIQKKTSHILFVLAQRPLESAGAEASSRQVADLANRGAEKQKETRKAGEKTSLRPLSAERSRAGKAKTGKSATLLKRMFRRKSI